MLTLPRKLAKDAPVAKNFGITHLADPSFYLSSEKEMLVLIQAAHTFVQNDHNTAPFQASSFSGHGIVLLDEVHVCHLEQDQGRLPYFALYFDIKIQQTKLVSYTIVSLYIRPIHSFDYNVTDNLKAQDASAKGLKCVSR